MVAKKPRAKRSDAGMKRGPQVSLKRKTNDTGSKENGPAPKRARAGNDGEGSSTGAFKSREFIGSDEDDLGEVESGSSEGSGEE